jgi:hypothetical protein
MKIETRTKIVCDICGKEIPWSMRKYIHVTEYVPYMFGIGRDKWDICRDCAEEMKDYIRAKTKQESEDI